MPQPKKYENAAARNRAYRQRQKQRASTNASTTGAAVTSLQSLHAAIGGAAGAGDATATAVYRPTATDTADALTRHFFRASTGQAASGGAAEAL